MIHSPSGDLAARRSPSARASGLIVGLGDIPVLLRIDDDAVGAVLRTFLPDLPTLPGPAAAQLTLGDPAPLVPDRPCDHSATDLEAWHEGNALLLRHRSGTAAEVRGAEARIGGGRGHGDRTYAVRRLFALVVSRLLAPLERFVLHGAALVHRGQAYVALGDTGTGKSSLALAALSAGWGVLADDLVIVRHAGASLEVSGIPRPLVVPGDLANADEVSRWVAGARPTPDDPRRRRELAPDILERGWWPVAGSMMLGHSAGTAGELRRLTAHEALPRVVAAFVWSGDTVSLRRFFPHAAALSRRPAWELRHGARPDQRLAAGRELLAAVVAAS